MSHCGNRDVLVQLYISIGLGCAYTLGNKVEIRKIKATGSADRDFLVIFSGHG